ncbi:methionine biosynthesis protein MetW [Afifella marina DSM 2698]|nr:methionine biosynthesis protein MetW [Afifella marina]MBK1624774.1 methionine biosynthesis protein MetW [Afifella marina DSM 2698]MBK1628586.1 methionine biosynthesis protein MetW [Afifella marina]MBK5915945.1 methionine biosynthesis protein MetW [Afifella marina]RAI20677.1 methionine biosynthesis protein MetW [Afifella marina DSM 2698]
MAADPDRVDLRVIAGFVSPGSRVLDVGCGDGALLKLLAQEKGVDGRGIELSQRGVNQAVAEGLSVIQGDADRDLETYPDGAFDFAILSQTLQATRNPRTVVENLLRIGRRAIVSFPNFGNWRIRSQFMVWGRMPITSNLPYSWYDTPNIHFCTIKDFLTLTGEIDAKIEDAVCLYGEGKRMTQTAPWTIWNLFGEQAVFVLSRG